MATLLQRLGLWSARRAWAVVVGWLALLGIAAAAFAAFGGSLASTFSLPGTATEAVTDRLEQELPELAGASATIVFETTEDGFDEATQRDIAELLERIAAVDGVADVVDPFATTAAIAEQAEAAAAGRAQLEAAEAALGASPVAPDAQTLAQFEAQLQALDAGERLLDAAAGIRFVSDDGRTAIAQVAFEAGQDAIPETTRTAVIELLDEGVPGVTVEASATIARSLGSLIGVGEIVGIALALVVLLVMLRALLPALLPLVSSGVGVGVGILAALALSDVVEMTSVTPALGVMLGLAVGIDYALFIVARHRRELMGGLPVASAVGIATGTAGSAVVFAGATVVVALLGLLVTGIPFLGVMGVVAAFCVIVAVLVAITLVPALLALLGERALDRRSREHRDGLRRAAPARPMRTGAAIAGSLAGVLALLVIAAPALTTRLALVDSVTESHDTTQYRAYAAVDEAFGPGRNAALLVVADLAEPVTADDATLVEADIVDALMATPNVAAAAPVGVSEDGLVIAFQVLPDTAADSVETEQLVATLRDGEPPAWVVELGVAGATSAAMDVSAKLAAALPAFLVLIVGVALVLLLAVFRSILVPIVATAGFVLSFAAALGAVTAVYQWGWLGDLFGVSDPGPILAFAPILVLGILFGLAMDYQLFLVTGMREAYAHGADARTAVVLGLRHGRGVVTAAAIIMASVFGGFVFSHLAAVRPIGFGLAVGVLFDAFVVRMLIIPGVMHLLGRSAWWLPGWLDRLLPDVDVEGAALERAPRAPMSEDPEVRGA